MNYSKKNLHILRLSKCGVIEILGVVTVLVCHCAYISVASAHLFLNKEGTYN